jgi:hypothetical protein
MERKKVVHENNKTLVSALDILRELDNYDMSSLVAMRNCINSRIERKLSEEQKWQK